MWKPRLDVPLVLLAGALAFVRPAPVTACSTDSECDNGDTCSVPDQCQGGTCVLGGGGDTNADLICDDEFVAGLDLRVTKLIIRTFPAAGPASASMHGAEDFIDLVPPGPFSSSGSIAIRVKDVLSGLPPPGDGADVTVPFGASDCVTSSGDMTCRLLSGQNRGSQAKFKRDPLAPEQVKYAFRLRGLDLTKPFFGPLRVILTDDTMIHRPGKVTDCRLFPTGIKCREF